jgi:hypothetical protein
VLQLDEFPGRLVDEVLDGVLVAQPVAATDGVVEVLLQTVVGLDHTGGATLSRTSVAAHRVDLRDQRDAQLRIGLYKCNCSAQPRASGSDYGHICLDRFHSDRSKVIAPGLLFATAEHPFIILIS